MFGGAISIDRLKRDLAWPVKQKPAVTWTPVQKPGQFAASLFNLVVDNSKVYADCTEAVRFRPYNGDWLNTLSASTEEVFEEAMPSLIVDAVPKIPDPAVTTADFFVLSSDNTAGLGERVSSQEKTPVVLNIAAASDVFLGNTPVVWTVVRHWHIPRQIPEDPLGAAAAVLPYHPISFTVTPSGMK